MRVETVQTTAPGGQVDLRLHRRVTGPFEGVRRALLDVDVQIYDLSEGGTITVKGETRHGRAAYGFGVRFVDLGEEDQKRLEQALDKLRRRRTTTH